MSRSMPGHNGSEKLSPAAVGISYTDAQSVMNIAEPGKTRNLHAAWHDNGVTLPNASKEDEYWELSEDNKGWVRYYFTGWYTAPDGGACVGRGGDAYTPKQDITLYAHWTYNVFVYYDGNTNDGGGMEMTDPVKGDEKTRGVDYIIRENNFTKTGYDFAGWNTEKPRCPGIARIALGRATDRPYWKIYRMFSNPAKPRDTKAA